VLEDPPYTLDDQRRGGFSDEVGRAVSGAGGGSGRAMTSSSDRIQRTELPWR